jgi:ArsR family transcriptional regulator
MVNIFKALSEDSRLRILSLVIDREMCVCEIENSLDMTQTNASRHLSALKQSGILECNKKAQWAYYRISESFRQENLELYEYLKKNLKALPTYERDNQEYMKCKDKNLCRHNNKPTGMK